MPAAARATRAHRRRSAAPPKHAHFQGGGSSHINPTQVDVPFDELQARAGDAELTYAEGYPADDTFRQDLIDEAVGWRGQRTWRCSTSRCPPTRNPKATTAPTST